MLNAFKISKRDIVKYVASGLGALALSGTVAVAQEAPKDKVKVYLNLSYSGNIWQAAAANGVKALAETPPYDTRVELKTIISGTDVQRQIADIESMIADKADIIIMYPLSGTALNRVIRRGCQQGILMVAYDSPVTESCAINVDTMSTRFGANSAQWIANQLGGKGEVVMNRGVAGTTLTTLYGEQAHKVFAKYPGIKVVAEFFANWNDATSQEEVAKVLAAHPEIDAIWTEDGTFGSLQAVTRNRPERSVVISGQSNNGFRLAMADPEMQAKGLRGLSSSQPPAEAPYAFKLAMEVFDGKKKLEHNNVTYQAPWLVNEDIKICEGDVYENGCNVFPEGKVSPMFLATSLDAEYLPELSLYSINEGKPTPGATIQELPPVRYSDNLPGINCSDCEAPEDYLEPNRPEVMPMVEP